MMQQGSVNGFKTAIWGGVTTLELAKAICVAIDSEISGLIHLTNGVGISKLELLNLFKEIWHKQDIDILPYNANDVDKSIAKSNKFNYVVSDYKSMLVELYDWMSTHEEIYGIYVK